MQREIVIVTAAYGNSVVRALGGQSELLPVIAAAKADGVEIRRELFSGEELDALPQLAERLNRTGCSRCIPCPSRCLTPAAS